MSPYERLYEACILVEANDGLDADSWDEFRDALAVAPTPEDMAEFALYARLWITKTYLPKTDDAYEYQRRLALLAKFEVTK
jgi:hypothetical protein